MTSVEVTHHFPEAVPETVFDAWMAPEKLGRWMFGPAIRGNEEILHLDVEPYVGGTFSFLVRRLGEDIDHAGRYLEIDRPNRLVFTWGIAPVEGEPSTVTILIEASPAGGTLLRLIHELGPGWDDYATRTKEAWEKMLGVLATAL